MEMKQVSENCFAVLNEKNRVCDANSGLINRAGGVVIDTQSDLAHARQVYQKMSQISPRDERSITGLARVTALSGDYAGAEKMLKEIAGKAGYQVDVTQDF